MCAACNNQHIAEWTQVARYFLWFNKKCMEYSSYKVFFGQCITITSCTLHSYGSAISDDFHMTSLIYCLYT